MTDTPPGLDPCARITRTGADGARLVACTHGGQVLGWTPAGGSDRLWTSPLARCGPGEAIRGGIPVVFPQFSDRGPLPKHGVVRDRAWRLVSSRDRPEDSAHEGPARLVVRMTDDDRTRGVWPHGFTLTLTVEAVADTLDVTLGVANTGPEPWSFAAALHAYLATSDAARATVTGLGGRRAEDNAAGRGPVTLPADPLTALGPRDVAVPDVAGPVILDDPVLGRLVVEAEGFTDRVLWNPGPGHGLGDVPPSGETSFVCVEPAVLTPVTLPTGGRWQGRLHLRSG